MTRIHITFIWGPVVVDISHITEPPEIVVTCDKCGRLGEFLITRDTPLDAQQARAEYLAKTHVCWNTDRFQGIQARSEATSVARTPSYP